MARPRSWTDEQFLAAVPRSECLADIARNMGLAPRNGQINRAFREAAARLGVTLPTIKPGPRYHRGRRR